MVGPVVPRGCRVWLVRQRGRSWRLACVLAILLCGLLAGSHRVWAHAALIESTPAAGAVLDHAPAQVVLRFGEPVDPVAMQLFGPDGHQLAGLRVQAQGSRVQVTLPVATGARGSYFLSWRVVSADGHPVRGVLDYAVGATSTPTAARVPGETTHRGAIWLARWLTYVCLVVVAGAVLSGPWRHADSIAWARPLACVGLALLLVDLALQGLDLVGAGWSGLWSLAVWTAALTSSYAWTLAFLALALLLALSVMRTLPPPGRILAACATPLLVAAAFALSGHASTAPPQGLARPAVALHVLMVLAWIGGLLPLARALRPATAGGPDLRLLARFSAVIPWGVALLVGSGIVLVGLQLNEPRDLWRSAYGRVLLVKLALVALLLLVAATNRWRWTEPALAGSRKALRALQWAMVVELILAVAVLAVVSAWRFTPPPRSGAAGPDMSASRAAGFVTPVAWQTERLHAQIMPVAGAPWSISLRTPQGAPFAAQEVTLVLDNPRAGIRALRVAARPVVPGRWQVAVPALPQVGRWLPALVVLVDDFDQIRLPAPEPLAAAGAPARASR